MRWGAMGSAAGAATVTLLMVLSPLAAAAHTYKPPYTGMITSPYESTGQSGCGTATVSKPFNWSSTTGMATFSGKVASKSCSVIVGPVGGDSYAYTDNEIQLALPLKMTTGTHNITVNWKLSPVISTTQTNGTCTGPTSATFFYCETYMYSEFEVYSELYDLTNGSYVPTVCCNYYWEDYSYGYNETEWYNYSGTGTFYNYSYAYSYLSPGTGTSWLNTTWSLNRAHAYYLIMYVYADVEDETYSDNAAFPGASITTSFNLLGSHAAILGSVVVA